MSANLPDHMQVVEISRPGGPDVLKVAKRPVPELKAGEVLIRVAAAGVNRPDCFQRAGAYPPPPDHSDLPGLEVAGTVVKLAEDVPAMETRRPGLRAHTGWRICSVLRSPRRTLPPIATGLDIRRSGVLAGDHVHGLDQCLRARTLDSG